MIWTTTEGDMTKKNMNVDMCKRIVKGSSSQPASQPAHKSLARKRALNL